MDSELQAYFEKTTAVKQERYDVRIAYEILKFLGVPKLRCGLIRAQAEQSGSPGGDFSPEWLSEQLHSPILFRAIKDYRIDGGTVACFPSPDALMHKWVTGGIWRKLWADVWEETRARTDAYAAACFRPAWAQDTIALHNYKNLLTLGPLQGASLVFQQPGGELILFSSLRDLVTALLRSGWRPSTHLFAPES